MGSHLNSTGLSVTATVYVIDDDAPVRRSVSALMSDAGIDHLCYDRASAFLADYQDHGPGCVITDVRMPEISGLQLLERMRAANINHPTIVMTGYSEVDTVIRAFRLGAIDVFEKPIVGSLLIERVQSAIENDRAARDQRRREQSLRQKIEKLSGRETEIMQYLIKGMPNKEIAWRLNLSDKTVAAHRANLLAKMDANSLAELITTVVSTNVDLSTFAGPELSIAAA